MRLTQVRVWTVTLCLLGAGLAFLGYCCVRGFVVSMQAEYTLHANRLVLRVVERYVSEHGGRWPTSWDDLEQVADPDERGRCSWPRDADEIRGRVHVDFGVTAAEVARQRPEVFEAVRPIGPNYGHCESDVRRLLAALRKHQR
jgi:hypothetical protein